MKAKWTLKVAVPQDWTAIANEYDSPQEQTIGPKLSEIAKFFGYEKWEEFEPKFFNFKETPRISTYLFALVAGPFDFFESIEDGHPPMRIYARASLKKEIKHEEMFKVTKIGIKFYEELFGRKYPFGKYDQVFVPEHAYGAMENVGCVTYNEAYLYKGLTYTL